jgi:hypothetical protein
MTLTEALHRIRAGLRDGEYIHDPGTGIDTFPYHQIRMNDNEGAILGEGLTAADAEREAAEWLMRETNAKEDR